MLLSHLNALRLGFSTKAAKDIQSMGISKYISNQLDKSVTLDMPSFIAEGPKSLSEFQTIRQNAKNSNGVNANQANKDLNKMGMAWKAYIIQRCNESEFPLLEKINLFFQNHFVVTLKSVKVPFWIFKYYETINKFALGNYKTLLREIIYSNAMIKYLDNQQNKKEKINENLARELLELFTLGEGNYSEDDIKNTALSLAGLTFGEEKGKYRLVLMDNSTKTVFGKSGNYKIDDVIDIIFEQSNTAYFITEKLLKWFFYDNPSKALIVKYGDYLKLNNFELKPFFKYLFSEECQNPHGGNQIKNPLTYILQIHHDLGLKPNYSFLSIVLKNQAMDIYDQPNVKGWTGGRGWLSSQIYADRNQFIDFVIDGNLKFQKVLNKRLEKIDAGEILFQPRLKLENMSNAKAILDEFCEKMIFETNEELISALNQLLKYDFDPRAENAQKSLLSVYQYLAKTPEFQII
jgi:uncharacterized protein (DUF1800 family)